MVGNFMIRKVSPLNAAFLGIRKPATKVSNNMNKMFANASGLRKRKVWNLKQKLSGNFSQSFLCDVAEFKEKTEKESELKRWGKALGTMTIGGVVAPIGGQLGLKEGRKLSNNLYANKLQRVEDLAWKQSRLKSVRDNDWDSIDIEPPPQGRLAKLKKTYLRRSNFINKGSAIGGAALGLAGTYGAYRAGKSLMNKLRNKNKKVK